MITSFWVDQNLAAHIKNRDVVLKELSASLQEFDKRACASSKGVDERNYKGNVDYLVYRTLERHEPGLEKVAKASVSLLLNNQVEATIMLSVNPELLVLCHTNTGLSLQH